MITVAIVTRRLRSGKTYADFRRAWFHNVGFGQSCKLYTTINVNNPSEIIVIAFSDFSNLKSEKEIRETLEIDIQERLKHSLDDVIEPDHIDRTFCLLRSEDDFSAAGAVAFTPPSVDGKEIDDAMFEQQLQSFKEHINAAQERRDRLKAARKN